MPSVVRFRNRLFSKLFLLIICIQCYAFAEAQGNTRIKEKLVTLSAQSIPLSVILKRISKNTGINIYFNNLQLASFTNVSINVKNKPFLEVIRQLLEPRGLDWVEADDNTITIRKAPETVPSDNILSPDSVITVYGKVITEKGVPVPGATVLIGGAKKGTSAQLDGSFVLYNVPKNATIMISNVSFLTQQVQIRGRSNLGSITMTPYVSDLDETVIKGYYNTTKRLNTGTVYTVRGEELAKQPVTNPIMALQGRVPNLQITPTSGLPNAAVTFQLRGQNSLSGTSLRSEPLIIIDGVPYQNTIQAGAFGSLAINNDQISALSFVNVNDIEQIDVLSDADATSIYGSRGGNGVIIITTKRGKSNITSINMSLSTGISKVNNKLDLLNTQQYIALRRQAYANDGLTLPNTTTSIKNFSNFDLTVWDTTRYTDWQKEFLGKTATSYAANLSITGGATTIQYLLNGNYSRQNYVFPGKNKYETGGTSLSITSNSPNNRFKAQLNSSFTFNNAISPNTDLTRLSVTLAPNAPPIYNSDGTLNWEPNLSSPTKSATWMNPYARLLRSSSANTTSFRQSGDMNYEIMSGLSIKISAGYSEVTVNSISIIPIASFDPSVSTNTGFAFRSHTKAKSFTLDPQLTYNLALGNGQLDVLVGATYQSQSQFFENIRGEGYTSDALLHSISGASITTGSNSNSQYKYNGLFGRVNYNLQGKYLLNLTGRRDGSSRFGPDHQFGNFWSIGGGWIFSQEDYFKNQTTALSFGKLRMSYGTSGNDGIGDYQYIELYEPAKDYIYNNSTPLRSNGVANPDYHWESVKKLELALDMGFFNDRIFLTTAYWRTRASDQLGTFPLPATGGAFYIIKNQNASIQNSGWDFILNTKNVTGKKFTWSTTANFGIQSNKLLSRPEGVYNGYGFNRFVIVGEPFTGFAIARKSKGVSTANGLYQFEGKDGNITDNGNNYEEAKKIDTKPLTMGITNNLSYKGISFSFFIQLTRQMGRNVVYDRAFTNYNPGSFNSQTSLEYGNLPVELLNNWKNPGDIAAFQRLTSANFSEPLKSSLEKAIASDLAWQDASFIKLRNVAISYSLPSALINKYHLNNLAFYIQGQNLLTITKYKGLDPEVQTATALPLLRTVTAGIQIGL